MEENKYVIDLDKLSKGDILLAIFDRRISSAMERVTGCKYHHAMLYVGNSSYIHSYDMGVQSANPMRNTFNQPDDVVALRLKDRNKVTIVRAINSVREKIGTQYSDDERRRVMGARDMDAVEMNRQFCTRLVAQAYEEAGGEIVENPDYCTLQDLITSQSLLVIPDVLRIGHKKELDYAREGSEALDNQEDIQNTILQKARNLSGADIQTFVQLEAYVIKHPKHDQEIAAIIRESGYLDMWKKEMEKNPQNYSFESFAAYYPKPHWPNVVNTYMPIVRQNLQNYPIGLQYYQFLSKTHALEYIQIQIELHKNLIRQFEQMEQTMKSALATLEQ